MRRRTRSVDRGETNKKSKNRMFGKRSQSVERPSSNAENYRRPKNALMSDDDDSSYGQSRGRSGRRPPRGGGGKASSTRSGFESGDEEDSLYSKKSNGNNGWFGSSSKGSPSKTKGGKSKKNVGGGSTTSGFDDEDDVDYGYGYDYDDQDHNSGMIDKNAHEKAYSKSLASVNDIEKLSQKRGANPMDERFKIIPDEAYPNTYMNREELRQEMNMKSAYFHDTRVGISKNHRSTSTTPAEVGQLRVEILQCFGLPASSLVREVSAYCVAVCGSHAFKTDVMPPVANPMWLSKMRRACLFPIQHAYARLFIGVFDDSVEGTSNDFLGRIAVDVARMRPMCSYDFTLPLRLSSNVFTRQHQGAIRIRVHLVWNSERNAIMSYIPKSVPKFQPNESVNVCCLDEQSFRNVAQTVHGVHMPGKFSMTLLKSTAREINFTRIHILRYMRKREIWNLVYWRYPVISGFVFLAWMHSIYTNTVRYIPGHIITFLLLHLYKNYAYYGMDSPLQNGFMPATIEELFNALVFGNRKKKKRYIEPLNMEVDGSHAITPEDHLDAHSDYKEANHNSVPLSDIAEAMRKSIRIQTHKYRLKTFQNCFLGNEAVDFLIQFGYAYTRPEAVALGRKLARETNLFEHIVKRHDFEDKAYFYHFLDYDTKKYIIKGHRPKLKRFFRLLGFTPEENPIMAARGHVEFPFATGTDHPRFTVKEALVIRSAEAKKIRKEEEAQQEILDCAEFGVIPAPPQEDTNAPKAQFITNAAGDVVNLAATLTTDVMKAGIGAVRAGARRASLIGGAMTGPSTPSTPTNEAKAAENEETTTKNKRRASFGAGMTAAEQQKMVVSIDSDDIYAKLKCRNNARLDEMLDQQHNADAFDELAYDSDADVEDMYKKKSKGFIIEEKILKKPPIQDMGVKQKNGDKSFANIMSEARHKAHGVLLHLFNDRSYSIDRDVFPATLPDENADRNSVESGKDKKKKKKHLLRGAFGGGGGANAEREKEQELEEEKKRKKRPVTPYDTRIEENDKILGINKYSHVNPWMNRIGVVVQPIVEIAQGWLYMFRALFNIFTWQDPFLSFLIAVGGPVLVLALHLMPYRIILFFAGFAAVGPQNYLLRLFRESKGDPPPDFDKLFKKKKIVKDEKVEEKQYFSSAAPGNQNIKYVHVDPKQVRHAVVPYGPLKYNRFYDWPPETEYARVYASAPPRNAILETGDNDDDEYDDEGFQIDARTVKGKRKKKKKGIKKLASQVKKGTGTVVVAGGELAKRTQKLTSGTVKGTAHLTTNVAKGAVGVTRGAVKGTAKTAKRGAKGVFKLGKRGSKYDEYDDDDSY